MPSKMWLLKEGVLPKVVRPGEMARVTIIDMTGEDVLVLLLDYGNLIYGVGKEDVIGYEDSGGGSRE